MLTLTERDVAAALDMKSCIAHVERAYALYAQDLLPSFYRAHGALNDRGGAFEILPCSHLDKGYFGFKYASSYPDNPGRGLPTVASTILLCDLESGFQVAHMAANILTALKTAASPAVATKYLARPGSCVAAVLGAGFQARYQVQGLNCVLDLKELHIHDRFPEAARKMAEWFTEEINPQVKVTVFEDADAAVETADVITTITTSFTPVLHGAALKPGAHVNAMGSWLPDMQEIDEQTVLRAAVLATDIPEDMWQVAGDILAPLRQGLISREHPVTRLSDIVAGKADGRRDNSQITIFESIGFSSLDIALAAAVYEEARQKGAGIEVPMFE